jgi:hypothetical protein
MSSTFSGQPTRSTQRPSVTFAATVVRVSLHDMSRNRAPVVPSTYSADRPVVRRRITERMIGAPKTAMWIAHTKSKPAAGRKRRLSMSASSVIRTRSSQPMLSACRRSRGRTLTSAKHWMCPDHAGNASERKRHRGRGRRRWERWSGWRLGCSLVE